MALNYRCRERGQSRRRNQVRDITQPEREVIIPAAITA
jgi:hypothetical protein